MNIFNKKAKEAAKDSSGFSSGIGKINNAFKLLSPTALAAAAGVGAIVTAVKTLVGFGGQIINVASQFEQVQTSLKTVLGDSDRAAMMFEDLRKFSFKTTFGVDQLADASSQLLNVGVSTSALQKDLQMLGDLAQGDKVKFQELTSIFAKVQSTGKATSMQLQQIALRGIPITQTLQEMGVKGTASAEQLTEAFKKLTGEGGKFQNAMQNINDTIEGKKGFISDTWKEILVNIGEITGLTEGWKKVLDTVADKLNDINNYLIRRKKIQNGEDLSWDDEINVLEKKIQKLENRLKQPNLTNSYREALQSQIDIYKAELEALTADSEMLSKAIEQDRAAIAAYEEQFNKFDRTKQSIQDRYYETDEGKREKAKKDLEELIALRDTTRVVRSYSPYGGVMNERIEGLDPETLRMTNVLIEEQKKVVYGTKEEVKDLGKTWKQAFEDVTGIAVKAGETGAQAAQRFIEGMDSDTMEEQFSKMMGLDGDAITQAQKKADDLRSTILSLMNAKTRAGDEFKWDDKSIQTLIDKYKEVNAEIETLNEKQAEKQRLDAINSDIAAAKQQEEILREQIRLIDEESASLERLDEVRRRAELTNQKYDSDKINELMSQEETNRQYEAVKKIKLQYQESFNLIKKQNDMMGKTRLEIAEIEELEELRTQNLGKQTEELEKQARELAKYKIAKQKSDELASATYLNNKFSDMVDEAAKNYNKLNENGDPTRKDFEAGKYAKGKAGQAAMSTIQGSDVGNFVEGFQQGGIWGGIINTVINAIVKVIGSLDGLEIALNPITELLQGSKPMFQALLVPAIYLSKILGVLGQVLFKITDFLSFGIFSKLSQHYESLVSTTTELNVQQQTEVDRLKNLNEQYAALKNAIKDQEEYYLKKRRELNADFINQQISAGLSVNDMILTPQGNFSTDPNDYIIATKNPQSLGGGSVVNVVVNNSMADSARVNVSQKKDSDGMTQLVINISKQVARDYANGNNGWDSAILARATSSQGRSLS